MHRQLTLAVLSCALTPLSCGTETESPPPPAQTAPFARADAGEPIPDSDLAEVTGMYLELLRDIRYFDVARERAHGWPASDPQGRFWYGTWWSGVDVVKQDGKVTYVHGEDGADNNGIRSAPLLEGALFAAETWGHPNDILLARELVRGFTSWIIAMESQGHPDAGALMTRASYPISISSTDDGTEVFIDYDRNHPGLDNDATEYVNVPDNPHWGNIWVKNKRSKDDLGHMMRAIAHVARHAKSLGDPALQQDAEQMLALYSAWCRRVEDDNWSIATYDKNLSVYIPTDSLAHLVQVLNGECNIILSLRLFGKGDPGPWDCENGISDIDVIGSVKPSNAQMFRAYHEGVVAQALLANRTDLANLLLAGLAERVDTVLDQLLSDEPPEAPIPEDMAELIVQAGNVGLPLTWREVRYVHDRIREAHESYRASEQHAVYHVLDATTPDGTYPFDPPGAGFFFRNIGAVLGTCASSFRSSTGHSILDCERVKTALRPGDP